jgi:Cd2+/Zn2+-exporting ATPase/Cu+-exporting ATPase
VGSSAKRGVLIKGGLFLEKLARVDTLVVDKTGTLTVGKPRVTDVVTFSEVNEQELVSLATSAETYSEHPLASAIVEYGKSSGARIEAPDELVTEPGKGITCKLRGKRVAIGNIELLDSENVQLDRIRVMEKLREFEDQGKTVLMIALEGKIQGIIAVADAVRQEVAQTLLELKRLGIKQIILLTGDNERVAAAVARSLGISQLRANLMPEDKIEEIRKLQTQGGNVVMIGDGVNDGPALAQADVGIAMGVSGSDVALEAAPLTLMRDDWAQIPMVVRAARRTVRTIRQNVAFGIMFNVAGVLLASIGILTPIFAAAAQSLPDVVVFLNSSRLLRS